jgi:uncharacterized protein (TIRG00374 family)
VTVRSWLTRLALLACAAGALLVFRDQLPDVPDMWSAALRASPGWLALVVIAEWLSMSMFVRLQRRLLLAGGVRMRLSRAFAVTYAGNALSTTLPAGAAVSVVYSFREFRRAGASARLATAVVLLGGVITTVAYAVIGLVALLSEPHSRGPAEVALAVLTSVIAALAVLFKFPRSRIVLIALTRRAVRPVLRLPRVGALLGQLGDVRGVVRLGRGDWGVLATLALLNWLFDILSLAAAAKAVGIEVALYEVALVYFAAQAAGSVLPLLPGGLGALDGSMVIGLAAFGAGPAAAGAATGLYRLVSYWAVIALGWLAWLALRAGEAPVRRIRPKLAAAMRALASRHPYASYCVPLPTTVTSAASPATPEPAEPR